MNEDSIEGGDNDETKKIGDFAPFDCVLFATGRVPNVKGMDLLNAGVEYSERDGVYVN